MAMIEIQIQGTCLNGQHLINQAIVSVLQAIYLFVCLFIFVVECLILFQFFLLLKMDSQIGSP